MPGRRCAAETAGPGVGRQVRRDVSADRARAAAGQRPGSTKQHGREQSRCRPRCCAAARPAPTPSSAGHGQVQRGPDDRRAARPGAERRPGAWPSARLAAGRSDEAATSIERRSHRGEHRQLGPQHRQPARAPPSAIDRIMPVPYSPVTSSTPSTPIASGPGAMPSRLTLTGLNRRRSWRRSRCAYWLALTAETARRCRPSATSATSSVQHGGAQRAGT